MSYNHHRPLRQEHFSFPNPNDRPNPVSHCNVCSDSLGLASLRSSYNFVRSNFASLTWQEIVVSLNQVETNMFAFLHRECNTLMCELSLLEWHWKNVYSFIRVIGWSSVAVALFESGDHDVEPQISEQDVLHFSLPIRCLLFVLCPSWAPCPTPRSQDLDPTTLLDITLLGCLELRPVQTTEAKLSKRATTIKRDS